METLKVVKLYPDVKLPEKKNPTDAGFDVYGYSFKKYFQNHDSNFERSFEGEPLKKFVIDHSIELSSHDRVLIGTGLKVTVGIGYEIQVRPRSGLALNNGLTVLNTPGTIDPEYKDELCIILINLSRKNQIVKLNERIAQLIISPILQVDIDVVQELPGLDRGGGLGSTGVK
jgi:dUTP pyrophosphatase